MCDRLDLDSPNMDAIEISDTIGMISSQVDGDGKGVIDVP